MSGLAKAQYKPDTYGQYDALHTMAMNTDWPAAGATFGWEFFGHIKRNKGLPLYDAANNFNILSCYVTMASMIPADEHTMQARVAANVVQTLSHPDSMIFTFLENSNFSRFHQQMNEEAKVVNSTVPLTPNKDRPQIPLIQPLIAADIDKNFIETPTYQICMIFQDAAKGKTLLQKADQAQMYLRSYTEQYNTF